MLKSYHRYYIIDRKRFVVASTTALAALTAIVGTAAVGYSAYSGITSMAGGEKAKTTAPSALPPLPTAPSPDTSLADAQTAAENRRKTILQSGGQTILTQQGMPGIGTGTGPKTLLGS